MRILLRDLSPGTAYEIQLRAKDDNGNVSDWSRLFDLSTTADVVPPKTPTGVANVVSGTAFKFTWDAVVESTDNTPAHDLKGYRVSVTSPNDADTRVYETTDTKMDFSFENNVAVFGTPQAAVRVKVAAVDTNGNVSPYSTDVLATNPAPVAVTGLTATAQTDGINIKWTANTTDADLKGYEIDLSTTGVGGTYNKVYSGNATSYVHPTTLYGIDHFFKVYSVDVFGTRSPATTSSAVRPTSPFLVDLTAPAVPAGLAITLTNATDGKTAKAAVTWTAVTDTDGDLSEYILDYKPSSESAWNTVKLDYEKTATTIVGLLPYTNYDFRIRSSDFSANLSAWSTTVVKTATTNAAPAVPTGLTLVAGKDDLLVRWTANTEADMANGAGVYDVTIATNSGFTTGVLQYRTGADNIAITGLSTGTQYWARVRATDSAGLSSAYATGVSATTSAYPVTPLTDGAVPVGAPTVTASGGLGYIYLTWSPVANTDPVTYDVYMSTTSGFTTYDATTKITEVSGTSAIIDTVVAGTTLVYGTTYYFKVRARDRDGVSATVSTQVSATPNKAGTSDISTIDAALITSGTSFTTNLFIGAGGAIQSTGYTAGGTTGFQLSNAGLIIKGTNNVVDAGVLKGGTITGTTINVGAGGVLNIDSTASVKSNNYSAGSTGYNLSSSGLEINDGTIDAKVIKTNSAIIGDLVIGRTTDALGSLKSFGYVAGTTGFKLDKTGLEINNGSISASSLRLQNSPNLMPSPFADFEYGNSYYVNAFWDSNGQGKMGVSNGVASIYTSTGALNEVFKGKQAGTMTSFNSSVTQWYYSAGATDYNIDVEPGKTYIVSGYFRHMTSTASDVTIYAKGDNAATLASLSVTFPASETVYSRKSFVVTVPAGVNQMLIWAEKTSATGSLTLRYDGMQVEEKTGADNSPSPWRPPGSTTIDGSGITTGLIKSVNTISVGGVAQPLWSINTAGNMQVGDALVRGKLIVGTSGEAPVNQAPGNGDFEANITGYSIYQVGATNAAVVRTTTVGEVITGTGSLKVTADAGAKSSLGAAFSVTTSFPAGSTLRLRGKVKVNVTTPGSQFKVNIWNEALGAIAQTILVTDPQAGVTYPFDYSYKVPSGQNAKTFILNELAGASTAIILDDISVTSDATIDSSYISSGNYISGVQGWKMDSQGFLEANSGALRGDMIVSGTVSANKFAPGAIPISVADPSFENAGEFLNYSDPTDPERWSILNLPAGATVNRSKGAVPARSGDSVALFYNGAQAVGTELSSASMPVVPGKTYRVSANALTLGGTPSAISIRLYTGPTKEMARVTLNDININNVIPPIPSMVDMDLSTYPLGTITQDMETGDRWFTGSFGGSQGTLAAVSSPVKAPETRAVEVTWTASSANPGTAGRRFWGLIPGKQYKVWIWAYVPTGSPHVRLCDIYGSYGTNTTAFDTWQALHATFTATNEDHYIGITTMAVNPTAGQKAYIAGWEDTQSIVAEDYTELVSDQITIPSGHYYAQVSIVAASGQTTPSWMAVDDISVTPAGQYFSELSAAGLRLFDQDGLESGAFVSNRANYFSVQTGGKTLAAISKSGGATFSSLTVGEETGPTYTAEGDVATGVEIYGTEFMEWLDPLPKGIIAYAVRTAASGYSTVIAPFLQLDAEFLPGRAYKVVAKGYYGTDTLNSRAVLTMRYTTNGTAAGTTSTQMASLRSPNNYAAGGLMTYHLEKPIYTVGSVPTDYSFVMCHQPDGGVGGSRMYGAGADAAEMWIEDIGLAQGDTGIDRTGGTPPVTKKNYVKAYVASATESYKESGVKRTDTTDVVQGYVAGTTNGRNRGLWIMPSTMVTDTSGSTVTKVEIYAYANHWYNSAGGTALIYVHNFSTIPASLTTSTSFTYITQSSSWPKPGGRWVTLPNSTISIGGTSATLYAHMAAGRIRGFGMGVTPTGSTSSTYYGRFNGSGAQVRVSYTK